MLDAEKFRKHWAGMGSDAKENKLLLKDIGPINEWSDPPGNGSIGGSVSSTKAHGQDKERLNLVNRG